MQKIVVIIPSYNNSEWFERNLSSIISQDYPNFQALYTDDASTDNTAELVEIYIEKHNVQNKIKLIKNTERLGALHNIYNMIHFCDDDVICVDCDGDDWLIGPNVLSRIAKEYEDRSTWMTFGSYIDVPGNTRGCCKPYERHVIDSNSFRRVPWRCSHARSRMAWLFKMVKKEDMLDANGSFYTSAWDLSFQFPCLEMSGYHCKYIHDILYCYNNQNPISDYKIRAQEQAKFDRAIRSKKSYERLHI